MREFYDAAMPAIAFIGDVLLVALLIATGMGIVVRALAENLEPRELGDLAALILIFATAFTAYVR